MKLKKGQGISVNVIIIAAIALIVLVVLVAVFTGRFGIFATGVDKATTCEEACKALGQEDVVCGDPTSAKIPGFTDKDGFECCCR